jgi:hypothetical protein
MHLSGQLVDWSVGDLLRIMQVTKKTGSLDIAGARKGRIHFRDGAVTGAELFGVTGEGKGTDPEAIADILYVLSTLESGTFTVGAAEGPEGDGYLVADVLKEVDVLRALEGEVVQAGLMAAKGIRLADDLERPITLDPGDWHALVTLVQPFSFEFLESRVGRGGAVRTLHALHRLGIADTADDVEIERPDDDAEGLAVDGSQPTWIEEVGFAGETAPELVVEPEPEIEVEDAPEPVLEPVPIAEQGPHPEHVLVRGVSAPASTTLTDGVYDEIRRLRSKAAEK